MGYEESLKSIEKAIETAEGKRLDDLKSKRSNLLKLLGREEVALPREKPTEKPTDKLKKSGKKK